MDRIPDSGSDDWGSTPHGRTIYPTFTPIKTLIHITFLANILKRKSKKVVPLQGYINIESNKKYLILCQKAKTKKPQPKRQAD